MIELLIISYDSASRFPFSPELEPQTRKFLQAVRDMEIKIALLGGENTRSLYGKLNRPNLGVFFNLVRGGCRDAGSSLRRACLELSTMRSATFYIGTDPVWLNQAKVDEIFAMGFIDGPQSHSLIGSANPNFMVSSLAEAADIIATFAGQENG